MSDTRQSSGRSHTLAIAIAIASLFATLLLLVNRQLVIDQISVWQYHPDSHVITLADRAAMSDQGKFYFYASHPVLESTQDFNDKCERKEESVAILGCYNGRYIYLFNVTDSRLDGIREVTAAHEMLHAAYDRLSEGERKELGMLLDDEYNKLKTDEKLAERMAFYARTEPGERQNELHSVIGTEIANVSSKLEEYYERYFTDRSKVVTLHHTYASVFDELHNRAKKSSEQLTNLGDRIEADTVDYNTAVTQLNEDIVAFNEKAENGGFSSQGEFESARRALVSRATQLDADRDSVSEQVKQYEALRQELISISSQSDALNRSIDSSLAPAPSL